METIGQRAVKAIRQRTSYKKTLGTVLNELDINRDNFRNWSNGRNDPSAYYLQQMALAGYDVIYILTGVKNNGKQIP